MNTAQSPRATRASGEMGAANTDRFARPLVVLHWLIALGFIAMLGVGLYMVGLPKGLPFKSTVVNVHKSLGITVFLLVLIRILVRMIVGRPPLPPMGAWQRAAAGITQALLYVGMVAMPLTGYLGSSFNKYGTKWWGVPLPQWGHDNPSLREAFYTAHGVIAWIMIALIALHFLGAMKHQFIDKDGLLKRMS